MRRTTVVSLVTLLTLAGSPAHADTGLWHSAGLAGVDSFGVYNAGRARARLSVSLRDTRKDGYSAATRLTFTERGRRRGRHVVALRGDAVRSAWRTVRSKNTGHLYVQECLGTWSGRRFRAKRCSGRRRPY